MRFTPGGSHGDYQDTPRKRAAYRRKLRLEQEALPLLAPLTAERQAAGPAEDEVFVGRAEQWIQGERRRRAARAKGWREARARLWRHHNARHALRALWNIAPYPADPGYLASMLHSYEAGRLDLDHPPWAYRPCEPGTNPQPGGPRDAAMTLLRRETAALADMEQDDPRAERAARRVARLAASYQIDLDPAGRPVDDRPGARP